MAYHLFVQGVDAPAAPRFVEGVTLGDPHINVIGGGNVTPQMQKIAKGMHDRSFKSDWVKGSGSTSSGLSWLFGEDDN